MTAQGGRTARRDPRSAGAQRRALLAKVHIAKKDLGLSDVDYRWVLVNEFRVRTAAALGVRELEGLVAYFVEKGWEPRGRRPIDPEVKESQILALQERAKGLAAGLENGEMRLRGLSRSILRVDDPAWSRDALKLKRIVAALEKIVKREIEGLGE